MNTSKTLLYAAALSASMLGSAYAADRQPAAADLFVSTILVPHAAPNLASADVSSSFATQDAQTAAAYFVAKVITAPRAEASISRGSQNASSRLDLSAADSFVQQVLIFK